MIVTTSLAYTVTVKIEDYEGDLAEERWCQVVAASINAPDPALEVGFAVAYIVNRCAVDLDDVAFSDMEQLPEAVAELLHDSIFHSDITSEECLVFDEIIVKPEFRRQGLGTRLITTILDETRKKLGSSYYALVFPEFLGEELERELDQGDARGDEKKHLEIQRRQHDTAVEFCRALGFEKVESSRVFHVRAVEA